MFASTDAGATRHVHAFVRRPGVRREVVVPRAHRELARRARTLPVDLYLEPLAEVIAATPTPDHGPPARVEIQVWQRRFDPETLRPSGLLLRGFEQAHAPGE